jgi:hypothetical protein
MENIHHPPKGTPIAPSLSSTAIGVTAGLTTELRPERDRVDKERSLVAVRYAPKAY